MVRLGCSKNDPFLTHKGNFQCPERWEGGCLKNVFNLYRMPGKVEEGIVNFLSWGVWIFSGNH